MNFPEVLYTIDILFVAFSLLFAVIGLWRGASGELASLLTLFLLLGTICFYYPALTQIAALQWDTLPAAAIQGLVLVVLLLSALIISVLLSKLLKQVWKSTVGVVIDKITGIFVGFLRGALIGISLLAALSLVPNEDLYLLLSEKSEIGGWVCTRFTPWLHPRLMELPVFDEQEN